MSENSELEELFKRTLRLIVDPVARQEHEHQVALKEAERTDPWRYYCRLCGHKDQNESRTELIDMAMAHIADGQPCGAGSIKMADQAGRLMHVWSYG